MLFQIISMIGTTWNAINYWFSSMTVAIPGVVSFALAAFLIYCVVRFLLHPLVGGRGSDQVKKGTKSKGNQKDG